MPTSTNRLSQENFERFCTLLLDKYGLSFSESRRNELEIAVMQAFASSTLSSIEDYYCYIKEGKDGGVELERLVNVATINETHFFRDAGQFEVLATHVFPELIARRKSMRTLRIWSAGCSSGEEPYSLAILLRELLPDINEWSITILGTDVNTNALDRARRASYSSWSFREEKSKYYRDKYFKVVGNRWELIPEIKSMVTFSQINLASNSYPAFETNTNFIDLIICRNVLIYLSEETIRAIINRMFECLQPGGWLVTAPSEGSHEVFRKFQVRTYPNAILYQRLTHTAALRQDRLQARLQEPIETKPITSADFFPALPLNTKPVPSTLPANRSAASHVPTQPILSVEDQNKLEDLQELISMGQSEKALNILLRIASSSRFVPDKVFIMIGQIYANRGEWDEAEQWCQRAIKENLLSLEAYYTMALVSQHNKKIAQAIEMMRKVVYLDSSDVLGHFELANLFFEAGQYQKALKSLDNAKRLLDSRLPNEVVPRSSGTTVNRLKDAIIRQQQQWNAILVDQSFL